MKHMQYKGKLCQSQLDVVVINMMANTQERFSDCRVYKYLSIYSGKRFKLKQSCSLARH